MGVTKDGIPFRFENIASVLRNNQGEIVAGIELCRNVEDREQAFEQLRTAMERLRQTQEQLVRTEKLAGIGQLAAGAAHEINNPAGFVLSNLNTMQDYVLEFFSLFDALEKPVAGDSCEGQLQTKNIRALGDIPLLSANPQQLIQMFLSMLVNATQAIENGGTITVRTCRKDDCVNIEIADDGVGIPENVTPNIFSIRFSPRGKWAAG